MAEADPQRVGADVQPLKAAEPRSPQARERSVYLEAYLAPFREWLDRDTVTEIIVNRPGEV